MWPAGGTNMASARERPQRLLDYHDIRYHIWHRNAVSSLDAHRRCEAHGDVQHLAGVDAVRVVGQEGDEPGHVVGAVPALPERIDNTGLEVRTPWLLAVLPDPPA